MAIHCSAHGATWPRSTTTSASTSTLSCRCTVSSSSACRWRDNTEWLTGTLRYPVLTAPMVLRFRASMKLVLLSTGVSGANGTRTPFIKITTPDQRAHLAVGDAALEHPEPAIGMDVADAALADYAFRALDATRDRVGGFNDSRFDVDDTQA